MNSISVDRMISGSGPAAVYLDYNSTTPLAQEVIDAMKHAMENSWGNPSSSHEVGSAAKRCVEQSRRSISGMIDGNPEEIIFTSGGTEANNMAIVSAITNRSVPGEKPHVITSSVEHDSVMKCLEDLEKRGLIEYSIVPVSPFNIQNILSSIQATIKDTTCLLTFMHANNESGIILPIREISRKVVTPANEFRLAEGLPRIYFHSDAAQTIGKIPVSITALGVDYLTIVGHKFYGPRIGALYVRDIRNPTPVVSLLQGGGQERGNRPGTENTVMIAGLGKACDLVTKDLETYSKRMCEMTTMLNDGLLANIPDIRINFDTDGIPSLYHLPNTLSIRVPSGLSGTAVLKQCKNELYASVGAACHSNLETPSKILIASGLSENEARRTIRLSVGRDTTEEEIRRVIAAFVRCSKHQCSKGPMD